MNKKSLIAVLCLVLVLGASLVYISVRPKISKAPTPETPASRWEEEVTKVENRPEETKGVYTIYTPEALASAKGTVLLFFHAPWCPQCRQIDTSITKDGLPSNVTVLKVDYDTHQELRTKYGVTIQTTFVKVNTAGEKLASYVAYDEPQFSSVQRALLP